jgi:hypothetical protein
LSGLVPDHRIGAGQPQVGERQAVDGDAQRLEIGGDQARAKFRGRDPGRRVLVVKLAVDGARRIGGPVRRGQPLHPPAFLIDQDRDIQAPHASPEIINDIGDLLWVIDIPLEQDQAPRIGLAEKSPLGR